MKGWLLLFFSGFFSLFGVVFGQAQYDLLHSSLQTFVQTRPGVISVSFVDLRNNQRVSIAEDRLFNPASVIKVPVMVEVFKQVSHLRFSLDDRLTLKASDKVGGAGSLQYHRVGGAYTIRYLVEEMVTHSDNTATKMLIEYVGKENINRTMRSLGLVNTKIGNSNLLKAEGLNFSTAGDMALLFSKIFYGQVVSPEVSKEMTAVMLRQKVKWGIPKYLPSDVRVANKTGTLAYVKNDTGIVFFENNPYVISVFTSKLEDKPFSTMWVAEISRIVYDWKVGKSNFVSSYVR